MDLRKERYGGYAGGHFRSKEREVAVADQGRGYRQEPEAFDTFNQRSETSPVHKRSSSYEEAVLIEQRHEELKRQIALKERQLADMTGERETIQMLRNRLGLKEMMADASSASIDHSSLGRRQLANMESARRGIYSSVSPDGSNSLVPNMVGMKSTTYGRGTSHEGVDSSQGFKNYGKPRFETKKDPMVSNYNTQQLHFNPTRQPKRTGPLGSQESNSSPLRNKSRSSNDSLSLKRQQPRISPYTRTVNRGSNSPHRREIQVIEEQVESSDQYYNESSNDHFINPQRVEPLRISSRIAQVSMPVAQPMNIEGVPQNARDKLYRERIEAMTLDNQSLQRRLNQVSSELERIVREREDLDRQNQMVEGDVSRHNALINNKDDIDGQNNILENDLDRMREMNSNLQVKLKSEEMTTAEISINLSHTTANKKNTEIEYHNQTHDYSHKNQRYEEICRDKVIVSQKLHNVDIELERLNRENLCFDHENIDMEAAISRLQTERRELLSQIEWITQKFDNAVREMTVGKRTVEQDSDWHTKLIVATNLQVALESFQRKRKQTTLNELVRYSEFDRQCHHKLKNLSNVMFRLGQYKLKVGIDQWYDKSLKPYMTRVQNEDISIVINCDKLIRRVFYAWKQYQQDKMDTYHFKTNAIEAIWHRVTQDARKEMKRAFDIWKQKKGFETHTIAMLRRVAKHRENRIEEQALNKWKNYSQSLEYACRMKVLHMNFTKKVFMSQVFYQLRTTCRREKQFRQRKLNQFYKAWQNYIQYNRHLMQSNMASIAFRDSNKIYTIRAVFNALRQHTETKKHALLEHAVKFDMDVAIKDTKDFNQDKSKSLLSKNQLRAGNITRIALGKRLYSYFQKLKMETEHYDQTMNGNVRNKILKVYLSKTGNYFNYWKKNVFEKEIRKKRKMIQDMQLDVEGKTNEALNEEKKLRVKEEGVRTSKRRMVDKTFKKLFYRNLQNSIDRWKDVCNEKSSKEDNAGYVIKRMRNRFLRQAFDRYVEFNRRSQQHTKNLARGDHIAETLRLRELRKMYNALCYYKNWRGRIKQVWHKVLSKFDYYQKMRAIKIWNDNAHEKHQKKLMLNQELLTNNITETNEELNKLTLNVHGQQVFIANQNKHLSRKAYRQIGNTFQRLYTSEIESKFYIWKSKVRDQKHKENIMRTSINHYLKNTKLVMQKVFVKFMSDDRKREYLENTKHTEIEAHDVSLVIAENQRLHGLVVAKLNAQKMETNCASQETERKVLHTMECMEKRAQNWCYRSRKRMIFEMWRTILKEEKAFAYSVKNVIEKTLWREGFSSINHQGREIDFTQKVHKMMFRYSTKGQRIKQGDCFTRWKYFAFNKVDDKQKALQEKLNLNNGNFDEFRNRVVAQNNARVMGFFMEKNLKNYFAGLLKVVKHLKLNKSKTLEFHERQRELRIVFALRRWNDRKKKTLHYGAQKQALMSRLMGANLRQVFKGWKFQYKNSKGLIVSLSNLEKMMRVKMETDALKNIKTFSNSKKLVLANNMMVGGKSFKNILSNLYQSRLSQSFNRYKDNCQQNGQTNEAMRTFYGKFGSFRQRDAFNWWKNKHSLAELKDDMADTGPVRAQHWLTEKQIDNLKDFMRSQHYTELEINKFYNDVCSKNETLMKKYMIRLKYKQHPDKKLLPIIMDRWKQFVQIRKTIKYQLRFCTNSTSNNKSDMQRAFNKWRKGPDALEEELWKLDIKVLEQLAIKTTKEMNECSDQIGENQAINNHLTLQRDEFLNYYIKGQILAMALVKDRNKFAEMQAISRWLQMNRRLSRRDILREIRDGSYLQANLEERKEHLETENETTEQENEEMEQFKKDGQLIIRNQGRLIDEVERYKDQLEDLGQDMEEYQKQNEELLKLVEAEEAQVQGMKAQGKKGKFIDKWVPIKDYGSLNAGTAVIPNIQETEEEKKKREKMEKLSKLGGAGIR